MAPKPRRRACAGSTARRCSRCTGRCSCPGKVDDKEIQLKRQNKIYFQINGVGHEAVGAAMAQVFRPGHDWFFFYYRDRAASLALGITPLEMFLQAVGAKPTSRKAARGRCLPTSRRRACTSRTRRRRPGPSSSRRCGCAEAGLYAAERGAEGATSPSRATRSSSSRPATARRARASSGSRSTPRATASSPSSTSSRTTATRSRSPSRSTPPAAASRKLLASFPNLLHPRGGRLRSARHRRGATARRRPTARARKGPGPGPRPRHPARTATRSPTTRRNYKTKEEREPEARARPGHDLPATARARGDRRAGGPGRASTPQLDDEVGSAADDAMAAPRARAGVRAATTSTRPTIDPRRGRLRDRARALGPADDDGRPAERVHARTRCAAIPRIVVFGEDVADASRDEALAERSRGRAASSR